MHRDAFERLICEWLDNQHDPSLRAQLDAAISTDADLASVLAEWQTFDRLLRSGLPTPRGIDWTRLHSVVSAGVSAASDADAALDTALARSPLVDQSVDWSRMRDRISAAVDADAALRRRSRGRRLWLSGAAASALTAAAALFVALLPSAPRGASPAVAGAIAQAVIAAPTETPRGGMAIASITGGEAPPAPQALFMIDPPKPAANESAAGYF